MAFRIKTIPMQIATDSGRARTMGASVMIAVPPQMAVPVLRSWVWSLSTFISRPIARPAIRVQMRQKR